MVTFGFNNATFTSWPLPGWTEPALVFTVPDTLLSLALVFDVEPISIRPGNPAPAQAVTFPSTNVARSSDGNERSKSPKLLTWLLTGAATATIAATARTSIAARLTGRPRLRVVIRHPPRTPTRSRYSGRMDSKVKSIAATNNATASSPSPATRVLD